MTTNRLDWTIENKSSWIATYKDGTMLVARTQVELMQKINRLDLNNSKTLMAVGNHTIYG